VCRAQRLARRALWTKPTSSCEMSENKSQSFWSSLPGVITAIAGMITALAILVTTLANLPSSGTSASPTPTHAATSAEPARSSTTSDSPSPGGSPASTSGPQVTPPSTASREIVFFAIRTDPDTGDRNPDLYAFNTGTEVERRLTTDPHPDSDPASSRDGKRIAFDAFRDPGDRNLWVLEQDGSYTQLTDDQRANAYPTWSPDGRRIAWSVGPAGSREIWVMDARDGSNRKRLATGGDDVWPSWGVNGLIAFARRVSGSSEIWVVNPDDRATTARITVGDGGGADPAWSPNGRSLAFTRVIGGIPRVFVAGANGHSGLRQLTPTSSCDCILPTWSPDGTQIAYEGPGRGDRPILVISAKGGAAKRITTNGLAPRWGS
jgi:Tol biopolymer transport system component